MSTSRISKYNHKVEISSITGGSNLLISWNGFQDRHDYFLAKDIEDLDILATEISQAVHNYKRKQLIYRHVRNSDK